MGVVFASNHTEFSLRCGKEADMNTAGGVLTSCKPRMEVLEGELQDAIFGADSGHLFEGRPKGVR